MIIVTIKGAEESTDYEIRTAYGDSGEACEAIEFAWKRGRWEIPTAEGFVVIGKAVLDGHVFTVEESDGE